VRLIFESGGDKIDLEMTADETYAAQQAFQHLMDAGYMRPDVYTSGRGRQNHPQMYGRPDTSGRFLPPRPDVYVHDVQARTLYGQQTPETPATGSTQPWTPMDATLLQMAEMPAVGSTQRLPQVKWAAIAILVGISVGLSVLSWQRLNNHSAAKVQAPIVQKGKFSTPEIK